VQYYPFISAKTYLIETSNTTWRSENILQPPFPKNNRPLLLQRICSIKETVVGNKKQNGPKKNMKNQKRALKCR
jgi:hypothetical protein